MPATGSPTATSVGLTWDAVADAGAYRVEVRPGAQASWTVDDDAITAAAHTVDELTCATAYQVRVRARGSGTTYAANWSEPSAPLTVTTGACAPPVFGETASSVSVAEDSEAGTQVGTVLATVTTGQPVSHALTAGNTGDAWTIDAATGELKLVGTLDYETTPSYSLTVTADAGTGGTAAATVAITVTDVDEPPAFGAASYAFSAAENVASATTLGTVTATDPEGGEAKEEGVS